ncbi:MAG: hypothetical protein Fur0011_3330 [Candidatus Microgenomates bacterium]
MRSIWEIFIRKRTTEVMLRDPNLRLDENLVGRDFEDAVAEELAKICAEEPVVIEPLGAVDTEIRSAKKPAGPIKAFQCPVGMTPEDFVRYSQYEGMTQDRLEKIAKSR